MCAHKHTLSLSHTHSWRPALFFFFANSMATAAPSSAPPCEGQLASALATLRLSREDSCSASAVRLAYKAALIRHHPDKPGGDPDALRRVQDAFATLLQSSEGMEPERSPAQGVVATAIGAAQSRVRRRRRPARSQTRANSTTTTTTTSAAAAPAAVEPAPPLFQAQPIGSTAACSSLVLAPLGICKRLHGLGGKGGSSVVFATASDGDGASKSLFVRIWAWRDESTAAALVLEMSAAAAVCDESTALVRWVEAPGWIGLVAATSCGRIHKWRLDGSRGPLRVASQCVLEAPTATSAYAMVASPVSLLLAAAADGRITAWDLEGDQCLASFGGEHERERACTAVAGQACNATAQGLLVATGFESGRTVVWRLPQGGSGGVYGFANGWMDG